MILSRYEMFGRALSEQRTCFYQMLEMLFVSEEYRGQGAGKQLIQYGIEKYGVNELTVKERNPLAKGFYEHMGCKVYKRIKLDEQGKA